MMLELMNAFIQGNDLILGGEGNPAAITVQIAVLGVILFFVIEQIPNLAGALSGGFTSALMTLPKLPKGQGSDPNYIPVRDRQTWAQQQQNQISGGGAKTNTQPKHDLSKDLMDRIAAHNLKHK